MCVTERVHDFRRTFRTMFHAMCVIERKLDRLGRSLKSFHAMCVSEITTGNKRKNIKGMFLIIYFKEPLLFQIA